MYIFRIVVKSGKTSTKFLSYMDCKISGHFWVIARPLPWPWPVLVRSPEA
jgi:hypothetical protein